MATLLTTGDTVTLITALITAVLGLAVALIKIFREGSKNETLNKRLDTTEKVVMAIGTAVNTMAPVLGVDKSRTLKGAIKGAANGQGVLGDLDGLLKRHGLNDKSTAELADPHQ